jgi:hypothetical protein
VRNDSWPLRRSDALFVVVIVLFALPDRGGEWSAGLPSTVIRVALMVAAISLWIRFRVFGGSDHSNG